MRQLCSLKKFMSLNDQVENWLRERTAAFSSSDRPFITLTYAQSWDGSITTRSGETLCFSGPEATRLTHQLRSLHDGILVGIGTVLSDDPQLTVREWEGDNPQPIVLDSQLRTPASAKVCHHPDKRCWILTVNGLSEALSPEATVIRLDGAGSDDDEVPLPWAMALLRERGIRSLMVEGGAAVITSFLKAELVDALVLTLSPKLVGGYKAVDELLGCGDRNSPGITSVHSCQAGDDVVVWGDLQYGGHSS